MASPPDETGPAGPAITPRDGQSAGLDGDSASPIILPDRTYRPRSPGLYDDDRETESPSSHAIVREDQIDSTDERAISPDAVFQMDEPSPQNEQPTPLDTEQPHEASVDDDSSRQESSSGGPEPPSAPSTHSHSTHESTGEGWPSPSPHIEVESPSSNEADSPEPTVQGASSSPAWTSSDLSATDGDSISANEPETPGPIGPDDFSQPGWPMAQTPTSPATPSLEPETNLEEAPRSPSPAPSGPPESSLPTAQPEQPTTTPAGPSSLDQRRGPAPAALQRRPAQRLDAGSRRQSDLVLPRWQPDAEITYCPICHTQFSFFVRKHHCRKCGRVVCNSCSPHRIIIPYQYIVRPPGSEVNIPQSLFMDSLGVGYVDIHGMPGGERVRLCNPCVPDPNTAPPQGSAGADTPSPSLSPRVSHQRSRSNIGDAYSAATSSSRYGMGFPVGGQIPDPFQPYGSRNRSFSMNPSGPALPGPSTGRSRPPPGSFYSPMGRMSRYPAGSSSTSTSFPSYPGGYGSYRHPAASSSSSSRHRALPPTPQIAEEDECPICHRELPQRHLPNFESLRESHITSCIQDHSTYGSPRRATGTEGPSEPPVAPRRTGMYTYAATEKDCIDDAECTICLEEFTVGVPMARLECLCRFHRSCITAWFVNHPGRCPVHQHDGFGY